MIAATYSQFISENLPSFTKQQESVLTPAFLRYLCKILSYQGLYKVGNELGIAQEVIALKKRFDGIQYAASRFWRGMWFWAESDNVSQSAKDAGITESDMHWCLDTFGPDEVLALKNKAANTPYVRHPNQKQQDKMILSAQRFCAQKAYGMRYITSDPAISLEDLKHDLLEAGITAMIRNDGVMADPNRPKTIHTHQKSYLNTTVANHATNLKEFANAQKRQRMTSHVVCERPVSDVKYYKNSDSNQHWKDGESKTISMEGITTTESDFGSTTSSLQDRVGEDATLMDFVSDPSDAYDNMEFLDEAALRLPGPVFSVTTIMMGMNHPAFDLWVKMRNLVSTDTLTNACEFFGIDITAYKRYMANYLKPKSKNKVKKPTTAIAA